MSIGKFSDVPYYLLLEYFTAILENIYPSGEGSTYGPVDGHQYSYAKNSIIRRGKYTISTESGFWTDFFIKNSDEYLKTQLAINPKIVDNSNNGKFFKFDRGNTKSMVISPPENGTWESGNEVYLRKDSLFHEWYKRRLVSDPDGTAYININKLFSYIGKIYTTSDYDTNIDLTLKEYENVFGVNMSHWHIETITMDQWAVNAIPENQRTEKIVELMFLYFDKVYSTVHNKLKAMWANLDPMEIPIELLYYMALGYKIILNDSISEISKREFVRDIIYFLKRKGSYTSLYIIWYLLTEGTINRFNVYERWHDWELPSVYPILYFNDQLYQSFYNVYSNVTGSEISHGAGQPYDTGGSIAKGMDSWYEFYYDKSKYFNYFKTDVSLAPSGAKQLSPHYRIELDLSDEPLNIDQDNPSNTKIINQEQITGLLDNFEIIRPASRFSHYNYLLGMDTNLSGKWVPTYSDPTILNTIYTQHLENLDGVPYSIIHKQVFMSTEWIIGHVYGTTNFLVQCYDLNFNLMEPSDIIIDTIDKITIKFDKPQTGWAFIIKTDVSLPGSTQIRITHNLNSRDLIIQAINEEREIIPLESVIIENLNEITATIPNIDDIPRIIIKKADVGESYVDELTSILTSPFTVNVPHNLGTFNVIASVYDFGTYEEIKPVSVRYLDMNNIEMTFNNAVHIIAVVQKCSDSSLFIGTTSIEHNQHEQMLGVILDDDTKYLLDPSLIEYIKTDFSGDNTSTSVNSVNNMRLMVVKADFMKYMESWVEDHNLNEQYQMTSFQKSIGTRFVPREVILQTVDTLVGVISKTSQNLIGTVKIEEYDYIWYQDDLPSTSNVPYNPENPGIKGSGPHGLGENIVWRMEHNLANLVNIIQFFNDEHEEIYPDSVSILSENVTIATFSYAVKGYALFKVIGNINYDAQFIQDIKYYQLGYGSTWEWDPISSGNLESVAVSGNINPLRTDDSYYYIDVNDTHFQEINITEIGLLDSSKRLIFYSKCRDIFKPENVGIMLHYKIKKLTF